MIKTSFYYLKLNLYMEWKLKSFCVNFTVLLLVYCVVNVNLGLSLSLVPTENEDSYSLPYKVFQFLSLVIAVYGAMSMILSRISGIYLITGWSLLSSGIYIFLLLRPGHKLSANDTALLIGLTLHFMHFLSSSLYILVGIEDFIEHSDHLEFPFDEEPLPVYQRKDPSSPPDYPTEGEASIVIDTTNVFEQTATRSIEVILAPTESTSNEIDLR